LYSRGRIRSSGRLVWAQKREVVSPGGKGVSWEGGKLPSYDAPKGEESTTTKKRRLLMVLRRGGKARYTEEKLTSAGGGGGITVRKSGGLKGG